MLDIDRRIDEGTELPSLPTMAVRTQSAPHSEELALADAPLGCTVGLELWVWLLCRSL